MGLILPTDPFCSCRLFQMPIYHNYVVAAGSDITSCIKIDKALVVYRFWQRHVMTSVITLLIYGKILAFFTPKRDLKVVLGAEDNYILTFVLLYY